MGLQIFNILKKRGNVITETDGPIASAASIIFLGGSERLVNKTATTIMIHRSWIMAFFAGNTNDWESLVKEIKKILSSTDDGMMEALEERTKLSLEKAEEFLNEETYFRPKQCVEFGIATGYCEDSSSNASATKEEKKEKSVIHAEKQEKPVIPKLNPVPLHLLEELG